MTNTTLLERFISQSGYKKSYLAKSLGITVFTLSQKINNKVEFWASEIDKLCELLDIGINDRMVIFFAK